MAAAKPLRPFCSVCKHTYRGTYVVHASTKSHRAAAYRASGDAKGMVTSKKEERRRKVAQARKSQDNWYREHTQYVRAHNRSRPNDGTRKVVHVTRYRRLDAGKAAGHWWELHELPQGLVRVRFSGATGSATTVMPATAEDRRHWGGRDGQRVDWIRRRAAR